jgi:class 3 adenylate cyclase
MVVRIEAITPGDEIYLTQAARLALAPAEVQTAVVDNFSLKGFTEPVPVYRVEQRHRTHIISNAFILLSDLRGFTRVTEQEPMDAIERVLDTLDVLIHRVSRQFAGTILFSVGDTHCLTFAEASQVIAAADKLSTDWMEASREWNFDCAINIALHCGKICAFRAFLYGDGVTVAGRVQKASLEVLADREGGIFVSSAVLDSLVGTPGRAPLSPSR